MQTKGGGKMPILWNGKEYEVLDTHENYTQCEDEDGNTIRLPAEVVQDRVFY